MIYFALYCVVAMSLFVIVGPLPESSSRKLAYALAIVGWPAVLVVAAVLAIVDGRSRPRRKKAS